MLGRAEREAEAQDPDVRGMDDEGSQPRKGPGRERRRVKPEAPVQSRVHPWHIVTPLLTPSNASLWEQLMARGNLAEALRRVEQNAGAAGIDG